MGHKPWDRPFRRSEKAKARRVWKREAADEAARWDADTRRLITEATDAGEWVIANAVITHRVIAGLPIDGMTLRQPNTGEPLDPDVMDLVLDPIRRMRDT